MRRWHKKVKAAEIAFRENRMPTESEINDALDRERQQAAAEHLQRLCDQSPMGVFFPTDVTESRRPSWSFATAFLRGNE